MYSSLPDIRANFQRTFARYVPLFRSNILLSVAVQVTAVEKPELRQYKNVIVCSIQGQRRLADFLAGGTSFQCPLCMSKLKHHR